MLTSAYDDAALRAALKSDFETLSGDSVSAPHVNAVIAHLLQTALAVSRDLARDWNESRSGTRLPAEVLAGAFKLLPLRDRISASHVSHHWRQSALAFPEVWNHIDIPPGHQKHAALVDMVLSRSGQIPVVISHRVSADPKGAVALLHVLPVVQKSRHLNIAVDIYNIHTEVILPICKTFIANAADLRVSLGRGGDDGFSLIVSTNRGLVRRIWFAGIPPKPNGRGQDVRGLVGFVLRRSGLDGLHSLTVDSTILSTLPNHLPLGLSRLTIHMRELERREDPESRGDTIASIATTVDALIRSTVTWDSLDVLPRLTMRTRAPVHVLLEVHGGELLAKHAQRLLDKLESLSLSHLPPVRIRGFSREVLRAVSAHSLADRVVFETRETRP